MTGLALEDTRASAAYDELLDVQGLPRKEFKALTDFLHKMTAEQLIHRQKEVHLCIREMGISFTVYSEGENIDREWPFDLIPRLISLKEWRHTRMGLIQRLKALNHFIDDIYNRQEILAEGIIPEYVIQASKGFRPQCLGISPAFGAWANICGSDLVRDANGEFYVLEDNLRVPSGVSYMLENRKVMKRIFPEVFEHQDILPNSDYPNRLRQLMCEMAPTNASNPTLVVLTPGVYNSAYFEHSYLAQQIGAYLVEGQDLLVQDDFLYMKTVAGLQKVDAVYRRVDDEFLDPLVFRKDSLLGVAGLMQVWKKGHVALINAPGAGVADDKVVYAYVPEMIRYYLNETPLIHSVPTYLCVDEDQRAYVLEHLQDLVIKPACESGGYGMLIGPHSEAHERQAFRKAILDNPRNYIAQPTLQLSTVPTLCENTLEPRHVDLRPFILQAASHYVTEGGLTRVALRKGSLVVNSSQGGGSKDTWILDTGEI